MFERFTESARQVVVLAQDETRMLKHNYVGTEHLLLGLIREESGVAATVLGSFGMTLEDVRTRVAQIVGEGNEFGSGQIPLTPRAKKVLELALREALSLGHNYIGTEHILLGIAREGKGVAMQILVAAGADAEAVRNRIIEQLPQETAATARGSTRVYPTMSRAPSTRWASLLLVAGTAVVALAVGLLLGWLIWG